MSVLLFRVGKILCAIEAMRQLTVLALPDQPPRVMGVGVVHGDKVPIND